MKQVSLCLALSDVTLCACIQCPHCLRLDAFNFNKLKNDNLGYRCKSRSVFNGLERPRGCEKTVASGYIHEAIMSLIGVDILLSEDYLARVASTAPVRLQVRTPAQPIVLVHKTAAQNLPAGLLYHAGRRPTACKLANQQYADNCAAEAEKRRVAFAQHLAEAKHLAAETARHEEAELAELCSFSPVASVEKECAVLMDDKPCDSTYPNFSPAPEYCPVLSVQHSMHATAPESMRAATPPPASESFVSQASSVQDPVLSYLLDQLH
ncbi:hypothetical protein DSO57_1032322 [Entomophthora muscae]|uniref:Uncharacterized protein n=1 Tax=Entomophthora muscae TaxID=34485 RepID=A0ACC2TMS6_9FUNG|nr:hypothetical protein DSO57_1032322 [Entomophthora muscae]